MKLAHGIVMALSAVALSGCLASKKAPPPAIGNVSHTALATMERVALGAKQCWFKSGDSEFRQYTLAPELVSYTGRPRILVVPAKNPNDRPLLVVQAEGNPARIEAFGPMMQQGHSSRISADINRWASGQKGC
jgi:hypothetical protein